MKRIINLFILCGIVLLGVCGCGNNEGINNDNKSINSKFTYLKTIIGSLDSNVIVSTDSYLMLDNDTILKYEFDQLFSNDTNYKVLDASEFEIANIYLGKNDNYDLYIGNGVSLKDNKLYLNDKLIKESEINEDETVIALYKGKAKKKISTTYYIKTDKAYYYVDKYKTNKEECEKYVDVKCVYDNRIKKDNTLTEYYNNILYIVLSGGNSSYLDSAIDETLVIFKDNKLYLYND